MKEKTDHRFTSVSRKEDGNRDRKREVTREQAADAAEVASKPHEAAQQRALCGREADRDESPIKYLISGRDGPKHRTRTKPQKNPRYSTTIAFERSKKHDVKEISKNRRPAADDRHGPLPRRQRVGGGR